MTFHFEDFIYFKCQSCDAKIHCDQCGEELAERLLIPKEMTNFAAQSVNINNK